ncbi:hypothetical protein P3T43_002694 [Paraburkholderia sp. GAS41]|uniref:cellulose biosynthesis protein BcsP n=1 Tax=Paraburkholderia sp. GAS41 TaxID=3035134 RepID=UPI003D194513
MSPSSDIETLFGHFGGNAGDYQEIGRENEASSARTRWPLLVTLDLTQPAIPAIPMRGDPLAQAAGEAGSAQAPQGNAQAASGSADAGRATTAQFRGKTPLFSRPHRRTIPPVGNAVKVDAPRGAERFSAVPQAGDTEPAKSEAQPLAVTAAQVPHAPLAAAPAAPIGNPASAFAAPVPPIGHAAPAFAAPAAAAMPAPVARALPTPVAFAAPAAPTFATRAASAPARAPSQPASTAFTASTPRATAPATPVAPAVQPSTILGQLFKPAAPSPAPAAPLSEAEATPASLGSLFRRLRGDAPTPATPTPHSWLTNGPRRS